MTQIDYAALAAAAAAAHDFTKEKGGDDFERELPEAGTALVRLREYIEVGLRKTASEKFPNKAPAQKARFTFEVVTPKHVKTVTKDDGSTLNIAPSISITATISNSPKSKFMQLFKQLNWDGKATHPAQLLGRGYLCEIVHAYAKGESAAAGNKPAYANLQKDGIFTLQPPRIVDPLAETVKEINVPELHNPKKLFLWAMPTKECWDALHIPGTYTKDGKEVSKNWVQEMLQEALDFKESALFQMLNGGALDLPTSAPAMEAPGKSVPPVDSSTQAAGACVTTSHSEPAAPAPEALAFALPSGPVDPLAGIGV